MNNFKQALKYGLVSGLIVGTGVASAVTTVDYVAIVTTATLEVTGAIAAGIAFFAMKKGVMAGIAFISALLRK